jgi:hypothetical protein
MKRNKHYFLRLAVIKTMLSGLLYLLMPLFAHFYHLVIGKAFDNYWGYVVLGGGIMILGNVILLVRAWALAFDSDVRKSYYEED